MLISFAWTEYSKSTSTRKLFITWTFNLVSTVESFTKFYITSLTWQRNFFAQVTFPGTGDSIRAKQLHMPCPSIVLHSLAVMDLTHLSADLRREPFWFSCYEMALGAENKILPRTLLIEWLIGSSVLRGHQDEIVSRSLEAHNCRYWHTWPLNCLQTFRRVSAKISWYISLGIPSRVARPSSSKQDTYVMAEACTRGSSLTCRFFM